jgi:SPP1 family predicted phage head-tail adaptor
VTVGARLRRRLVLEEREAVADGSGGFVATWRPLGTLWAEMEPRPGREDFIGGRPVARMKYRILLRARPVGAPSRPRSDQRLRHGERVFNILGVTEHDAVGRYLEITAEEGVL